jgi:hypothetical protein
MNLRFEVRLKHTPEYIYIIQAPNIQQAIHKAIMRLNKPKEEIVRIQAKLIDNEGA